MEEYPARIFLPGSRSQSQGEASSRTCSTYDEEKKKKQKSLLMLLSYGYTILGLVEGGWMDSTYLVRIGIEYLSPSILQASPREKTMGCKRYLQSLGSFILSCFLFSFAVFGEEGSESTVSLVLWFFPSLSLYFVRGKEGTLKEWLNVN
jgi:hypothetical protein